MPTCKRLIHAIIACVMTAECGTRRRESERERQEIDNPRGLRMEK